MPFCQVDQYKSRYSQLPHPSSKVFADPHSEPEEEYSSCNDEISEQSKRFDEEWREMNTWIHYEKELEADVEPIKIYYEINGHGPIKVLLIMGLAATLDAWNLQVAALIEKRQLFEEAQDWSNNQNLFEDTNVVAQGVGSIEPEAWGSGIQVCTFDNRGVGKSSIPMGKSAYRTSIMAMDALALMDHLGWEKAHVFGHSMGAMISCKLSALAPHRIASLALISGTGGGYQCLPKMDMTSLQIIYKFLKARTPEERAHVDLMTHYSKEFLDEDIGGITRREELYKEYVKNIRASGMQPKYGLNGQAYACWMHKMTAEELDRLRSSGFLILILHGRQDVIAEIRHSRDLARKVHPVAKLVELSGGHLVTYENAKEVNRKLLDLIQATHARVDHKEWNRESMSMIEENRSIFSIFRKKMYTEASTVDEIEGKRRFTFWIGPLRWLLS